MIYATISGFLAKDPVKKVSNNGTNYVLLTIPSNYGSGDNVKTIWTTLMVFDLDKYKKFLSILKKGSYIHAQVTIIENNGYVSNKDGSIMSDLKCIVNALSFGAKSNQAETKPSIADTIANF